MNKKKTNEERAKESENREKCVVKNDVKQGVSPKASSRAVKRTTAKKKRTVPHKSRITFCFHISMMVMEIELIKMTSKQKLRISSNFHSKMGVRI